MRQFFQISIRSLRQLVSRPLYWYGIFLLPCFLMWFLTDEMKEGIPQRAPAGVVDLDHSNLSRQVRRTLGGMQLLTLTAESDSYAQALEDVKAGRTYGFFLIPQNYEADVLAGRAPTISFYTNMTYFVPGTLLYKNFTTTAVYTKAGVLSQVAIQATGASMGQLTPMLNPVNVQTRPIGNPWMNYNYYLSNGFVPAVLELMIFLITIYSILEEVKRGTSPQLMQMADGSVIKVITAKLLPQTLIWWVIALAMESWLFCWNHFPMYGSWLWLTVSTLLFVLACQGFALLITAAVPNMRMALSIGALTGILAFSLAAFSFPVQSMYGAVGIFSWILPVRLYYLIYIGNCLDAVPLFYMRWYFVGYFAFILAPLTMMWHLKKHLLKPVYLP